MKANALVFCILATLFNSHVSAAPPTTSCTLLVHPINKGADFVKYKVSFITDTFNPRLMSSATAPTCSLPVNSPYADDLASAFDISPQFFQTELCNLTCVYIVQCPGTGCVATDLVNNTWGFRERPNQFVPPSSSFPGRYIATSAGLWGLGANVGAAPHLDDYETKLVGGLINWTTSTTVTGFKPPVFTAPNPNGPENASVMTVLAALAHEFGHVLWYDTFRPTSGGPYDFNTFCGGTFFDNSWQSVNPPPVWRYFGVPQNQHKAYDAQIAQLALAITRQDFASAGESLHKIFRPAGHWASLFSAFSPDEDFVETFKFYVLTHLPTNPLRSLPITFTGNQDYTHDIWSDIFQHDKKGELQRKLDCFNQ